MPNSDQIEDAALPSANVSPTLTKAPAARRAELSEEEEPPEEELPPYEEPPEEEPPEKSPPPAYSPAAKTPTSPQGKTVAGTPAETPDETPEQTPIATKTSTQFIPYTTTLPNGQPTIGTITQYNPYPVYENGATGNTPQFAAVSALAAWTTYRLLPQSIKEPFENAVTNTVKKIGAPIVDLFNNLTYSKQNTPAQNRINTR